MTNDDAAVARVGRAGLLPRRWPRRHVVVGLASLAGVIAYSDRVNMAVAAVTMRERYGWSQTDKGLVLSAFFVGYMLFMLPSGYLATRHGGFRVLGLAVLTWTLFTLATPAAAALPLLVLLAARIGMGLGEAATYPASYELIGRWVPAEERSRAVARVLSGVPLGTVAGLLGTGWIIERYDWPVAFYAFGAVGLLWCLVWFSSVRNDPATDPWLAADERARLPASPAAGPRAAIPWRRLLLRAPVIAIAVAHFATTWNLYVLMSWLPSYFREALGVSIASAGMLSAAPWIVMFVMTNLSGIAADALIRRGVSVTATRKGMQCVGLLVSAACLLALRGVASAGEAEWWLCSATAALSLCWAGCTAAHVDVAPRHAALVMGFSNTFATLPGVIGVAAVGWLIDVTGTYSAAFVLTAGVSLVGAAVFALWFDARPLLD